MSFTSGTNVREEDSQPVFMCEVVRKEEERPESMTKPPHGTLLTSSLCPVERLSRCQQRLSFSVGFLLLHTLILRRFSLITPSLCHQSPHRRRFRAPTYYMGWAFPGLGQKMLSLMTELLGTSWLIEKNDSWIQVIWNEDLTRDGETEAQTHS